MAEIPCHTDLHPGRNVYLTSWFILSVLFLTGSETSVVPTCVLHPPWTSTLVPTLSVLFLTGSDIPTCGQNPRHTDLHPRIDDYLTSWFILSVWYLTGGDMSVDLPS